MHAVIFSGGTFTKSVLIEHVVKKADLIIAADSGAKTALQLGITPNVVVGDFDSLSTSLQKKLQQKNSILLPYPKEKNETDTELAIRYALGHGATKITILGGNSGNRFDHVIANLLLSFTTNIPIYFMEGKQISWVVKGPIKVVILGKKGDLLSLIPLIGNVEDIVSKNLYYPLVSETFLFGKPRGISNVLTNKKVTVSFTKGYLLIVHTVM